MREIGLDPTRGGKRGDPQRLEIQMRRFFSSRIAFFEQHEVDGRRGETAEFMQVARTYTLWWDSKAPLQGALWGSSVKLDREFYEAITTAPVPVDIRALKALKRSPLALDLYALCCYEAHRVERTGQGRLIPWRALMKQLGAEYETEHAHKEFARKCRLALHKVATVMPSLRLSDVKGGLALLPSSLPPISPKPVT